MKVFIGYKTKVGKFYGNFPNHAKQFGIKPLFPSRKLLVDTKTGPKAIEYDRVIRYAGNGLWSTED